MCFFDFLLQYCFHCIVSLYFSYSFFSSYSFELVSHFLFDIQLFDFENPLNTDADKWIFSTEGHIFKLDKRYQETGFLENDFFQLEKFHHRNISMNKNHFINKKVSFAFNQDNLLFN